jgi:hypothetical protein
VPGKNNSSIIVDSLVSFWFVHGVVSNLGEDLISMSLCVVLSLHAWALLHHILFEIFFILFVCCCWLLHLSCTQLFGSSLGSWGSFSIPFGIEGGPAIFFQLFYGSFKPHTHITTVRNRYRQMPLGMFSVYLSRVKRKS